MLSPIRFVFCSTFRNCCGLSLIFLFFSNRSAGTGFCSLYFESREQSFQYLSWAEPWSLKCLLGLKSCRREFRLRIEVEDKTFRLSPPQKAMLLRSQRELSLLQSSVGIKQLSIFHHEPSTPIRLVKHNAGVQIEAPLRPIDKILLAMSFVDTNPTERGVIVIYDQKNHIIYKSPNITSGSAESNDTSTWHREIEEQIQILGEQIGLIELNHSHPYFEFIIELSQNRAYKLIASSLSKQDFEYVARMSRTFSQHKIAISAAVPNGKRYFAIFKSGENISNWFFDF